MAHKWTDVDQGVFTLVREPKRKCERCGVVQSKATHHQWGRVIKYQWLPLVGRCPADKKG